MIGIKIRVCLLVFRQIHSECHFIWASILAHSVRPFSFLGATPTSIQVGVVGGSLSHPPSCLKIQSAFLFTMLWVIEQFIPKLIYTQYARLNMPEVWLTICPKFDWVLPPGNQWSNLRFSSTHLRAIWSTSVWRLFKEIATLLSLYLLTVFLSN